MHFGAARKLAQRGRLGALPAFLRTMNEFSRACFLVAAARAGVLEALRAGPRSAPELLEARGLAAEAEPGLVAWLDVGVSLGELSLDAGEYALSGRLARVLAESSNDDMLAMLEELTELHHRLLLESPERLAKSEQFTLADQDGEVVARSSRMLEPLIEAALDEIVPRVGRFRVLEIGCGSGTYLGYMSRRNPELSAQGIELQASVADQALRNLRAWGVDDRVAVACADVRSWSHGEPFDLVTMHNNIYYFGIDARVDVLRHVRQFLKPGGRLLLTTATRGGSPSGSTLSLWGAMTEGCAPLPTPDELCRDLQRAGFQRARSESLAGPFERFHAFWAN